MSRFFIDRPIFAWVIALFILVFGAVSITKLPVAQYPTVAPPSLVVSAAYPGASAQTLDESVISVLEQELNGSPNLAYIESVSQANGTGAITISPTRELALQIYGVLSELCAGHRQMLNAFWANLCEI